MSIALHDNHKVSEPESPQKCFGKLSLEKIDPKLQHLSQVCNTVALNKTDEMFLLKVFKFLKSTRFQLEISLQKGLSC